MRTKPQPTEAGTIWATRLLLWLLLMLPAAIQAQFNYTTNGGTIAITGYTGPGGAVTIPDTINGLPVTSIQSSTFYNLQTLTSVTIPEGVILIGSEAFANCTSLTNITIPSSVTVIGYAAFQYCFRLTSVSIPDAATLIGGWAFASCTNLTSVTIPNSVSTIGDYAFAWCSSMSTITVDALNSAFASVDGVLYNKSQTLLIKCPGGKAGTHTIPNGVTHIGANGFQECKNLTGVTIPGSVTSIGDETFSGCSSLTGVTIPTSVTTIGAFAFSTCTSLTTITIPRNVTNIGRGAAFVGCTSLGAITVEALNSIYKSVDEVMFNKSQTVLLQCPGGKAGSFAIPGSVTSIGDYAFADCASLTGVTIPDGVTWIGDVAFYNCAGLTSVTIPHGVTRIGSSTFSYCTSLASVTIPSSVTSIDQFAFFRCARLTSVAIPNSVTSIGSYAFSYCTNLAGAYFGGNAPSVSCCLFDIASNVTVYYLPGTTGWGTATFAGRPAVLWNPLIPTTHASFGVRTNRFGFTITGASNLVIVVVASTNLTNTVWIPVGTNILTGGSSYFSDTEWTNHPARFYRLRSP